MSIVAEPLTDAAFAPFGEVVVHAGAAKRHPLPLAFASTGEAPIEPRMWSNQLAGHVAADLEVRLLERHPRSAQSFVPLDGDGLLAIVCLSRPDGSPDLGTLRAFLVPRDQGIIYGVGVWHHGMVALRRDSRVVVIMGFADQDDDTVFLDLAEPILVTSLDHGAGA